MVGGTKTPGWSVEEPITALHVGPYLIREASISHHFPATTPIPIVKTPTNTTIEIPAYTIPLTNAIVIMVLLLPESYCCPYSPQGMSGIAHTTH